MLSAFRTKTKLALDRLLRSRAEELSEDDLTQDAWVVAPHPDDETLGCGGTIAAKTEHGARVRVVFVSDGSSSHARWMNQVDLAARRKAEGRRACSHLGVRAEDIHFLDLPDGELSNHVEQGTVSLAGLFSDSPVEQFFLPHRLEPPPDHAAAATMAMAALRSPHLGGMVFEYPVWLWARWPWVPRRDDPASDHGLVRQAPLIAAGIREVTSELRCRVDVRAQLRRKKEALSHHETQTLRLEGQEEWPVLSDVAEGEFLERFFSGSEYFHRSIAAA
jgi:LmbE family N-acetylglucosaminyl deacetylase